MARLDEPLGALFEGLRHLLAEPSRPCWNAAGGHQFPIEPGRPLAADLLLQAERRKDPDPWAVTAAAEVVGHAAIDHVSGDPPMVNVDALHVVLAPQRLQAADVEADEGLRVLALPLEAVADPFEVPARLVDAGAVLGHDGDVAVHRLRVSGEIQFVVTLTRVEDGSEHDQKFIEWCEYNFPNFFASCRPRNDWLGKLDIETSAAPDVGCGQWFQINILADGYDAFCATDPDGDHGFKMNVRDHNVLDIYNRPERLALRASSNMRSKVPLCSDCSLLA
jgi:hypothetical protein